MFRSISALLVVAVLAGCQTTTSAQTASLPASGIGPGQSLLSEDTAAYLFREVCVGNFPNSANVRATLLANGFEPSPTTGTFYDNKRNVSFKLTGRNRLDKCSMVFASRAKPVNLALVFAVASTVGDDEGKAAVQIDPKRNISRTKSRGGSIMTFGPTRKVGNKSYYRAVLTAEN